MSRTRVAIAGGGLAGSLMAALLAQRGIEAAVYERRGDLRTHSHSAGKSINLALSTRGLRALSKVRTSGAESVADLVLSDAVPMHGRRMHAATGEQTFQPYGLEGQYINSVSRRKLNETLITVAEGHGVEFVFNAKVTSVDFAKSGLTYRDATGTHTKTFDGIIGADGAFSAVRRQMQRTTRFDFSQSFLPSGYKELVMPPRDGDFAMEPNALHIWPRHAYMLIALPNADMTFTCTLFLPYEAQTQRGMDAASSDVVIPSFEALADPAVFAAFFRETFPDVVPLIPDLDAQLRENPIGSMVTIRCGRHIQERTLLLGDAAHAIVPFYGQGMNAAFEDCTLLDEAIAQHQESDAISASAFHQACADYAHARPRHADAIADLALGNFIEMQSSVAKASFLRTKRIERRFMKRHQIWCAHSTLWSPSRTCPTTTRALRPQGSRRGCSPC